MPKAKEITPNTMKPTLHLTAFLAAATLAAIAPKSTAALLYYYTFENTLTENSGTGTATATTQGSPTITTGIGGRAGSYAKFDDGDSATSDAINVTIDADNITAGSFTVSFYTYTPTNSGIWNDYFGFTDTDDANILQVQYGPPADTGRTAALYGTYGSGPANPAIQLNDSAWHFIEITGATSGADAVITWSIDGTQVGTNTVTDAASTVIKDLRIGGRPLDNERYINAYIDDFKVYNTTVPEPGSTLIFLSLGGLGLLVRRRKT